MKRSSRMEVVMKLAKSHEDLAARQLGEARQILDEQTSRFNELSNYREQYTDQLAETGYQSVRAMDMRNYRVFVGQLGCALEQQQAVVEQFHRRVNEIHQLWVEQRAHTQAIKKLIDKFKSDERTTENLREQKILDEYAIQFGLKLEK